MSTLSAVTSCWSVRFYVCMYDLIFISSEFPLSELCFVYVVCKMRVAYNFQADKLFGKICKRTGGVKVVALLNI